MSKSQSTPHYQGIMANVRDLPDAPPATLDEARQIAQECLDSPRRFVMLTTREALLLCKAVVSTPSETAPLVAGDLAKQREIHDTYAPVSSTPRTMTLPDVIGPVTPLVGEVAERCGDMEGTESMQEVVAGVLNALVQTFEEWPQGFAASAIEPMSKPTHDGILEAAAVEVESHWNHVDTEVNQRAQAQRSAAAIRKMKFSRADDTGEKK